MFFGNISLENSDIFKAAGPTIVMYILYMGYLRLITYTYSSLGIKYIFKMYINKIKYVIIKLYLLKKKHSEFFYDLFI